MTKKLTRLEAFQELSVQLARIENKLDLLLEQNNPTSVSDIVTSIEIPKEWRVDFKPFVENQDTTPESPRPFINLDKFGGSTQSVSSDAWTNTIAGKLQE